MGNKQARQSKRASIGDPYPRQEQASFVSNVPSVPSAPVVPMQMANTSYAPPSYDEAISPSFGSPAYPQLNSGKLVQETTIQTTNYQTYQATPNYGHQQVYPGQGYPPVQSYGHPQQPYQQPQPYPQAAPLPQGPNPMAPTTYVIPKAFDAGARFDGIATPHIPPPPPGCAPNAAQLAAAQGHNVVLGQKKSSVIKGGSNGGYTFW